MKNKFCVAKISKELARCLGVLESGRVPKYRGYDITKDDFLATVLCLKERFDKNFLKRYEGEFLEQIIAAALNLGMNFGIELEKEKRETLNCIIEMQKMIIEAHEKRNQN